MRTRPSASWTDAAARRGVFIAPVRENIPVTGSYTSADASVLPLAPTPPATRHQHTAVRQSCDCVQSARDRHGPCVCKSPRTRMAGAGLKPGRCYNGTEIRWRGHGRLSFALQSWTTLNRDTATCNPQTRDRCIGEWNPIQEMQKAHNSATSRSSNTATILIAQQPPPCSDRYSIKYHTDVLTPPSEACIIRWIHADSRESVGQFSLK